VTADQTTGWLERHFATQCYTDGCYYLLLHEMFFSAYMVTQKNLVTLRGGICNVCFGILTSVIT